MVIFQLWLLRKIKAQHPSNESQCQSWPRVLYCFHSDCCVSLLICLLVVTAGSAAQFWLGRDSSITSHQHLLHFTDSLSVSGFSPRFFILVAKTLHGPAPSHLTELLQKHTPVKALSSTHQMSLDTPGSWQKKQVTEFLQWLLLIWASTVVLIS